MKKRYSARAIIVNEEGNVLLLKFSFPKFNDPITPSIKEFWITPGGGVRLFESLESALTRELKEELGISSATIERKVASKYYHLEKSGRPFMSIEHYYLVKCDNVDLSSNAMTSNEKKTFLGLKWWTITELESTIEQVRPIEMKCWVKEVCLNARS